jgi:uncharacterized membrane protein
MEKNTLEEESERNKVLKEIAPTIFTRRLTIIVLIVLALVLQFWLRIYFRPTVFYTLIFWFLTTLIFPWIAKKQSTRQKIENLHFGYFAFELILVTLMIHFIGGIEWMGAVFYIFTIIYANIFLSRFTGLLITLAALVFYTGLVFFEYFEIIPHYEIFLFSGLYKNFFYLITTLIAPVWGVFILIALATGIFADRLKERTRELEEIKTTLEVKVRERTWELEEERASLEEKVKARTEELRDLIGKQEKIVKERTGELQEKVQELERFNKLAVGRELKMIGLKKQIKKLGGDSKLGEEKKAIF